MKSALLLLTVAALIELPIGTALWSQHATLITNLIKATSLILWAVTLVTGATILVGVLAAVRFASSFLAGMAVIATTLLASLIGAVGGLAAPFAAVWFIGRQWPVLSDSRYLWNTFNNPPDVYRHRRRCRTASAHPRACPIGR